MKLSKLYLLLALNAILIAVTIVTTQAKLTATPPVSFLFKTSQTQVKAGDTVNLSLYLTGKEADKVSVMDIKLNYDQTKLKLNSAKKGEFYADGLVLKWDNLQTHYALAQNPTVKSTPPQTNAPVITLEFTVIAKSGATQVTSDQESLVYISKKGGFSPKSQTAVLIIQ